jgi:hypothetical protein
MRQEFTVVSIGQCVEESGSEDATTQIARVDGCLARVLDEFDRVIQQVGAEFIALRAWKLL